MDNNSKFFQHKNMGEVTNLIEEKLQLMVFAQKYYFNNCWHLFLLLSKCQLVEGCLLVAGTGQQVTIVGGNVTTEHRAELLALHQPIAIGRAPGVDHIVLAG
jgi:hypothetical protein